MNYQERISELAQNAQETLRDRHDVELDFTLPHVRGRRPGDANSEFLSNRGMGDWAEEVLHRGLNNTLAGYRTVKYGNSDQIIAGDPKFPAFYANYQDELASTGKRPDLLIFTEENYNADWEDNISAFPLEQLREITPKAHAGIEVRSSKFFADEYAAIRVAERKAGTIHRACQSFTTKVEDLRIVKRWIDNYGVKHFYAQVFFDSVYMISFEKILLLIGEGADGVTIEENRRNQNKPTIHIPVTYGARISGFSTPAQFTARTRKTRLARLDAYVEPVGGELEMETEILLATIEREAPETNTPTTLFAL